MAIRFLEKSEEVIPFVPHVRKGADEARAALGFLPDRVYEDAALQNKLIVAVDSSDDGVSYVGHLLFGGVYPNAKIFQIFVRPEFRSRRIAQQILDRLTRRLVSEHYLSISARVALDLTRANAFWSSAGFSVVRTINDNSPGKRAINVRAKGLDTPTLFTSRERRRVAMARVVSSRLAQKTELKEEMSTRGVVTKESVDRLTKGDDVVCSNFDQIILFRKPVVLNRLRELECIDRSNLVTSRSITHEQLVSVAMEGGISAEV